MSINPDLPDQADEERRLFFVGLTRARRAVYIFTWKGNESEFMASIEASFDFSSAIRDKGRVLARVVQVTEKALQLEFETRNHEKIARWVPKSQVRSSYDPRAPGVQEIQLALWIVDKLERDISGPDKDELALRDKLMRGGYSFW